MLWASHNHLKHSLDIPNTYVLISFVDFYTYIFIYLYISDLGSIHIFDGFSHCEVIGFFSAVGHNEF